MISLVKIVTEGYAFDADDYIPYANLKPGDIVRCNENPEDKFKVLEVPGDNKLIVSLVDDPRDIRAVIFDEDVTAHASDQEDGDEDLSEVKDPRDEQIRAKVEEFLDPNTGIFSNIEAGKIRRNMAEVIAAIKEDYSEPGFDDIDSMTEQDFCEILDASGIISWEDGDEELADIEEAEDSTYDPKEIISALPDHAEVVAEGEGFDTVKLEEAIEKLLERPYFKEELDNQEDRWGNKLAYRYVSFRMCNRPDKMEAGPALEVNLTGKYLLPADSYWSKNDKPQEERKCDTPATAAPKVQNLLVGMMTPEELKQHVKGWILIDLNAGTHCAEFYPMLDEIGVRMYIQADKDLTADVNKFYSNTNYSGD